MADPEQINADQRTFWKGQGGRTWVARQEHTDITLAPVSEALLALAAAAAVLMIPDASTYGTLWLLRAPASECWTSAVAAEHPRWTLRAPSADRDAWQRSTSPDRCWLRDKGAPKAPASPMSIGKKPIPQQLRWADTTCWCRTSA